MAVFGKPKLPCKLHAQILNRKLFTFATFDSTLLCTFSKNWIAPLKTNEIQKDYWDRYCLLKNCSFNFHGYLSLRNTATGELWCIDIRFCPDLHRSCASFNCTRNQQSNQKTFFFSKIRIPNENALIFCSVFISSKLRWILVRCLANDVLRFS